MEHLRKQLKRIEKLTYLRERKAKRIESLRDILFRDIVKTHTFLFKSVEDYKLQLRRQSIILERIDIQIKNLINNLK